MAIDNAEDHFIGRVALKAVIVKDGKVLVSRNVGDERWDLPGGRMNKNESPEAALRREVMEELGVGIEIGPVVHATTFIMRRTGDPHFFLAYKATLTNVEQAFILPPDEIEEAKWVSKEEVAALPLHGDLAEVLTRILS